MSQGYYPNKGVPIKDGIDLSNLLSGVEFTLDVPGNNLQDEVDDTIQFDNFLDDLLSEDSDETRQYGMFEEIREKMVDLTDDGKLKKYIVREGTGPNPGDVPVFVHYIAYIENNKTPFDSTYGRLKKPEKIKLGVGAVYEGFEMAVKSMKKDEISLFLIHPDLAFKSMGVPPRIPKNATLFLEIELVEIGKNVEEKMDDGLQIKDKRSFSEVYNQVKALLVQSRMDFSINNISSIISNYRKAERLLSSCRLMNDTEEAKWKKLLFKVYLNLCVCYNNEKYNKPKLVCVTAREALQTVPEFAEKSDKLFYQFGKAKLALHSLSDALGCFKRAAKLRGVEDAEIKRQIDLVLLKMDEEQNGEELDKHIGFSPSRAEK